MTTDTCQPYYCPTAASTECCGEHGGFTTCCERPDLHRPVNVANPQVTVDAWNKRVPIGTPVRYWTGDRNGTPLTGLTRTPAQLLGGHTPVVWVTGHGACIALTHVDPIEPA